MIKAIQALTKVMQATGITAERCSEIIDRFNEIGECVYGD